MKRPHDDEEADGEKPKAVNLGFSIPDLQVRVPLPSFPRVVSIDESGVETVAAPLTPLDVQNASNKRVFRVNEWGKNVLKDVSQPLDPLEHLGDEDKQIVLLLGYAKSEMALLGQFADALAEGKRLQLDYVPPTLPLVSEEHALKAARLKLRKDALGKAATSLKEAAARLKRAVPQDKAFYAELRVLRKHWSLQIVGGTKFTPVLSAVCAAQYGIPAQDSSVPLGRSETTGSVQVVVPVLLRDRLCFNHASAWPRIPREASTAVGVAQVHAFLGELQRCARSKILYTLLHGGIPAASQLPHASVRDSGHVISTALMVKAAAAEKYSFSLGQPQKEESSLIEVHLSFLLSQLLRHMRSGIPLVYGEVNWFATAVCASGFAWTLKLQSHELCRQEADAVFFRACREHKGLSVAWGGCDMIVKDDGSASVVSNAVFRRCGKRVIVSLTDAGSKWLVDTTMQYGLVEVVKCVLETLK